VEAVEAMTLVGFRAENHPQQSGRRGAVDKVDDRRTPDSIWLPLHQRYGFTLDVAASAENAKTARYFTVEDDGLARSWAGERVWCNPPYSDIRPWVAKAWQSMNDPGGPSPVIVMLLPANRTEQAWWQELVELWRDGGTPIHRGVTLSTRFLAGRPRFDVPDGTYSDPRGNRPPFGCVLLTWSREASTRAPDGVPGALPAVRGSEHGR
jgi:phage N-6-adenine-methyltransferase